MNFNVSLGSYPCEQIWFWSGVYQWSPDKIHKSKMKLKAGKEEQETCYQVSCYLVNKSPVLISLLLVSSYTSQEKNSYHELNKGLKVF